MATFSQRIGLKPMTKSIQIRSIDIELRNILWSALTLFLWDSFDSNVSIYNERALAANAEIERIVHSYYFSILKHSLDTVPAVKGGPRTAYNEMRQTVLEGPWNAAYDLIDHCVRHAPKSTRESLKEFINDHLERENAGYRFVGDQLVEITEEAEISAIEDALKAPNRGSKQHFGRALEFLSDRKTPDYRNSIKESISAVESTAQSMTGNAKGTLGDCLKQLKKSTPIHPAFESALIKLFAWTSDSGGIRHALSDQPDEPTYADAKFMLVTCSAFSSYLWTRAAEAKK